MKFFRDSVVCAGVAAALFTLLSTDAIWVGLWPPRFWPVYAGLIVALSVFSGPMLALFWRWPVQAIRQKCGRRLSN